jgi:YVTN family beta-propeller protein
MVLRKALSLMLCALSIIVLLGCQATISRLKPPLEEEGEIYLYTQSLPQEADRLRFTIEKIFAVSNEGLEIPLVVSLREIKGLEVKRQRLLASGRIPPGSYSGLAFQVKNAILKVEEGEAALLVPEKPVRVEFPFNVSRKKAYVISLNFKYRESITGDISFSPLFSIKIPAKPISSLAGYVTNYNANNIIVFDKKLGQVTGVITTGRGPAGMTLDQKRRRAYVGISGDDTIEVIDVTAGEAIDRLRLNSGDQPKELGLTPDGNTLLTVNTGSNTVSIINPISLMELARIKVGNGPNSLLIDPTGRRAYIFNTLSSTISVIDIPNKAIVTTISTDPGPLRGQFNRRGDKIYVIHEWSSYLSVIDPLSLSVAKRFSVSMGMTSIKFDANTDLVYLGRKNDTIVQAYDPFSFVPVDLINTRGGITYMTIDGAENNLYLVNPGVGTLMVTNLANKKMVFVIDVGEGPYWVTVMGER